MPLGYLSSFYFILFYFNFFFINSTLNLCQGVMFWRFSGERRQARSERGALPPSLVLLSNNNNNNIDLICDTNLADIVPGYKTDHSMILLKIALHYNPRGRGFWKLNTSLLKEEKYLNLIKATIYQRKSEYQSDNSVNPALLWDMIKMKVREKSIAYAAPKNYKLSPVTISFTKKYRFSRKNWMKTLP